MCLVSVDSDTLNSANNAVTLSAFYQTYIFVPVIDGKFIVENPVVTLDRRMVNGVSFICHHLSIISGRSRIVLYRTFFCQSQILSKAVYLLLLPRRTSPISSARSFLSLAFSRLIKLQATTLP